MKLFRLAVIVSLFSLIAAAKDSPLASGKLVLPQELSANAKGIRTVFISISDAKSRMPMPYAAQKLTLKKDADGEFLPFSLSRGSMTVMGHGEAPAEMDIKAKLSKEGSAGPDRPGDIVGRLNGVKKGAKGLKLVLDKAVP